jgi:hypothetical protein
MATTNYNKRVVNVKPTSIAMVEGVFAAVIGLTVAILFSLRTSVQIADSTQSVLAGLTFGIAGGALAILVVPLVYFGLGWLVGLLHGFVLNVLIETAGGVELKITDNK